MSASAKNASSPCRQICRKLSWMQARKCQKYENELFLKTEKELEDFLKTKMTFVEVDIPAFQKKAADAVLAKFDPDQKALYTKIVNMK